MAEAYELNGWLAFDELDSGGAAIEQSFVIGYRFLDNRSEVWTRRFSRFKNDYRPSLNAGASILRTAMPVLLDALGLEGEDVTLIPALRSGERRAPVRGVLPLIAEFCAKGCGSEFRLDLLRKRPHSRLHGRLRTAAEREDIIEEARYRAGEVESQNIFILDDLITRGTTLSAIASAIIRSNPGVTVYGMALAKNDRQQYLMDFDQAYTNDHIPSEWGEIWTRYDKG